MRGHIRRDERDARIEKLEAEVHELKHPKPKTVRAMCVRDGDFHPCIFLELPEGTTSIVSLDGDTLFISIDLLQSPNTVKDLNP